MKRVLIPILVGIFLTVLFFALAGFLGGACHCVTPTNLFFPYAAIILGGTSWEAISFLLIALQFPLYAIILANVKGSRRQTLVFLILLAFHAAATLVGLKVHHR
jgi:hypothetical protein